MKRTFLIKAQGYEEREKKGYDDGMISGVSINEVLEIEADDLVQAIDAATDIVKFKAAGLNTFTLQLHGIKYEK